MQGWRAKRRTGAWLALGALLLQLALSFGHVHAEDFAVGRVDAGPAAAAGNPGSAPDDHDGGPGHDACAICAAVHLAGALVLPVPPAIVLPAVMAGPPAAPPTEFLLTVSRGSPFRSRAPPLA